MTNVKKLKKCQLLSIPKRLRLLDMAELLRSSNCYQIVMSLCMKEITFLHSSKHKNAFLTFRNT